MHKSLPYISKNILNIKSYYTCHSEFIVEKDINNIPVFALENVTKNLSHSNTHVFVATGYKKMNKIRQKLYEEMKEKNTLASFIHPNIDIWDNTKIGENVFLFEDNTIQPFTSIGIILYCGVVTMWDTIQALATIVLFPLM